MYRDMLHLEPFVDYGRKPVINAKARCYERRAFSHTGSRRSARHINGDAACYGVAPQSSSTTPHAHAF
ncbi:hypothetical protein COO72_10035 [Bifidobacterium callitrichos]|nr:hypothetical protein COO72_10035 [Bifidobacterium callitrichos]